MSSLSNLPAAAYFSTRARPRARGGVPAASTRFLRIAPRKTSACPDSFDKRRMYGDDTSGGAAAAQCRLRIRNDLWRAGMHPRRRLVAFVLTRRHPMENR
jgi:hypothetical protein